MLVRVCERCNERVGEFYFEDVCLTVRKNKQKALQLSGRDFCSFACLRAYVTERVEGQG